LQVLEGHAEKDNQLGIGRAIEQVLVGIVSSFGFLSIIGRRGRRRSNRRR
jgi:hypothetical protein